MSVETISPRANDQRLVSIVYVNGEDAALAQLDTDLTWEYRRYVGLGLL